MEAKRCMAGMTSRVKEVVPIRIEAAASSDCGRVRENNEDAWFLDVERGIFIVADGLGGHAGGEVASRMAVSTLPSLLSECPPPEDPDTVRTVSEAVLRTNRIICDEGMRRPHLAGMGSTLVLALIRGCRLVLAHVGDSRAYLLRGGNLQHLTRDHSIVQELLDARRITQEQAAMHPARAVVTRCLGIPGDAEPEIRCMALQEGDRLLLCTDGLTNMLPDEDIAALLARRLPDAACEALVAAANEAGGEDNITVVVVHMGS